MEIKKLVRSNIQQLTPYLSARDEFSGQACIFLDANENPYDNELNRYPDPKQMELRKMIASVKGVTSDKVFLGNGSDEVLDVILRSFCEPGVDNIVITPPTYGMYKILAEINNIGIKEAILNADFSLNMNEIYKVADSNTKALILCSPNNPTGNLLDTESIEFLLKELNCLVIIDEAYIDFTGEISWVSRLEEFPNLIVTQTFSKAPGMAGIRLGMAFASEEINLILQKVKLPYNVNILTQQKAMAYLRSQGDNSDKLSLIIEQRGILKSALKEIPFVLEVFSSDANFLLVKLNDAGSIYDFLLKNGIVIRNRSKEVLCDNCLRITVGTAEENLKLIEVLKSLTLNPSPKERDLINLTLSRNFGNPMERGLIIPDIKKSNFISPLSLGEGQGGEAKKVLFIDRDGTLVIEPPSDFQVDSFEKLEFYPRVFQFLSKIAEELDYELVMVTNQDGLGTSSFPEDLFWPVQNKIIKAFENEGIVFSEVLIDRTFPEDKALTRKPGTAMLQKYFSEEYDLKNSYVIGDRITDMVLAKNLGARGIFIANADATSFESDVQVMQTNEWSVIYEFLKLKDRIFEARRTTSETDIYVRVNLDGKGIGTIDTGITFFDHMLNQVARHSNIDLEIRVNGDLHVDEHHSIEDTAMVLGEAINKALGNKAGIERYGFCLPMDDCLAQVALDFGGRNWIVWDAEFKREMIGQMPTEMFFHFFKSFSDSAKCNLNIKAEGNNEHHKIEAIFKAFSKAIKMAIKREVSNMQLPTTKGII